MEMFSDEILIRPSPLLASAARIYIAFSGGLDSTVLLHCAVAQLPINKLRAVHVNHGLSPNSRAWQLHCRDISGQLGIALVTRNVVVSAGGQGVEQAARHARYQCFTELLEPEDVLLMAHHLDDQMETLIYRMLRGSGPRGLAGMPETRRLGHGVLFRPLLGYRRDQLERYAVANSLAWIHDESNDSPAFDRNYLRHHVIPAIERRWPDYRQRLLRTAAQCASAGELIVERAREDLARLDPRQERLGFSLDLEMFSGLSFPRQQNVLREWVASKGMEPMSHSTPGAVFDDLLQAREDASPLVLWPGGEFRRFRGRLYLLPPDVGNSDDSPFHVKALDELCCLSNGFALRFDKCRGEKALRISGTDRVEVRFRRGGERCRPLNRPGSAPLKILFQEYGLEPWLRNRIPLIYVNGDLAAVGDLFVCDGSACEGDEEGVTPVWFLY